MKFDQVRLKIWRVGIFFVGRPTHFFWESRDRRPGIEIDAFQPWGRNNHATVKALLSSEKHDFLWAFQQKVQI